ncbi:unnamed protein product, partial [Nesidiocoris tenuis]
MRRIELRKISRRNRDTFPKTRQRFRLSRSVGLASGCRLTRRGRRNTRVGRCLRLHTNGGDGAEMRKGVRNWGTSAFGVSTIIWYIE